MARRSYFRTVAGPPAGKVAVLRPPRIPTWGFPGPEAGLSQPLLGDEGLRVATDDLSAESRGSQASPVRPGARTGEDLDGRVPVYSKRRAGLDQTIERSRNADLTASTRPLAANSGSTAEPQVGKTANSAWSLLEAMATGRGRTNLAFVHASESSKAAGADVPKVVSLASRSVESNPRQASSVSPIDRPSGNQAGDRTAPGKSTVHIGAIDIHITQPPAAPRTKVAQHRPTSSSNALSRGFTSAIGLRQG